MRLQDWQMALHNRQMSFGDWQTPSFDWQKASCDSSGREFSLFEFIHSGGA